jgi:hypothetical protein
MGIRGVLSCALWLLCAAQATAQPAFRAASQASLASTGNAITFVAAGAATTSDAGCPRAVTPATPAGNVDDILVALAVAREDAATVAASGGWTQLYAATYAPAGQEFRAFIFYRVATNTGADSITVTESGTCSSLAARVSRFRGANTAQPFVNVPIPGANASMQNTDPIATGTETPDVGNSMLLVASFSNDDNGLAQGVGWSTAFESAHNLARDLSFNLHYQLQADPAPVSVGGWNQGATDENIGVIFALRPQAGNLLSIPFPAGTLAGDVMVATIAVRPSTATVVAPAGWTLIQSTTQGGGTTSTLASYYRVATGSEPAAYVFSVGGVASTGIVGGIASFSGVDTANPIDAQGGNATASSLTHTANAITTTVANTMLVGAFEFASSPLPANWNPGGMTEAVDGRSDPAPANTGIALSVGYVLQAALGSTGTRSATASGVAADTGAAQLIALRGLANVVFDVLSGDYALACAAYPIDITIVARDTNGNAVPTYTNPVNITTSTGTGNWSVGVANGVLNNGANNDGAATYQFVAADLGRIVLRLAVTAVSTVSVTVQDAVTGFAAGGIPIDFVADGYRIIPDAIQVAGRPQAISVERRNNCNLSQAQGHNANNAVKIWLSLDASHPGTATLPGATGASAVNPLPTAEPGANNITLAFAGGVAPVTLNTSDVGKYRLNIRDTNTARRGVSPAITTRPFALAMTKPGVLHSNAATDAVLGAAGADFAMTVGAYLWAGGDDGNNDGVPDAGANVTDNGLVPRFAWTTALSVPLGQVLPAGGADGTLSLGGAAPTVSSASFAGGAAALANVRYSEVGSAMIAATAQAFLDTPGADVTGHSGLDGTGNGTAGYVGRFRPDRFMASGALLENRAALLPACVSGFSYMGEAMRLAFVLTAQNAQGVKTDKYQGAYAKHDPTGGIGGAKAAYGLGARSGTTNLTTRVSAFYPGATPAWTAGALTIPAANPVHVAVERANPDNPDGPYAATSIGIAPTDSDGVAITGMDLDVDNSGADDHVAVGATDIRFGRLRMQNALGSEKLPLPMPIEVQQWGGTGFARNTDDGCTTIPRSAVAMTFNPFGAGTPPALAACETALTTASVVFAAGAGTMALAAPGATESGPVRLTVNLGSAGGNYCTGVGGAFDPATSAGMSYLLGRWVDAADPDASAATMYDDKPSAIGAFGLYGSQPSNFIFFRENY